MAANFIAISGMPSSGRSVLAATYLDAVRGAGGDGRLVQPLKADSGTIRRLAVLRAPQRGVTELGLGWPARERILGDYLSSRLTAIAETEVKPALARGITVIADRWVIDHDVNQAFFATGSEPADALGQVRPPGLPRPSVTAVLVVPVGVAVGRAQRAGTGPRSQDRDFLAHAKRSYESAATAHGALLLDGELPVKRLVALLQEAVDRSHGG